MCLKIKISPCNDGSYDFEIPEPEKKMTVKEAVNKFGEKLLGKNIKIKASIIKVFPENIWVQILTPQGPIINIEHENIEFV